AHARPVSGPVRRRLLSPSALARGAPAVRGGVRIHGACVCGEWKFRLPFDDPRCLEVFRKAGQLGCPVVLHLDVPYLPDRETGRTPARSSAASPSASCSGGTTTAAICWNSCRRWNCLPMSRSGCSSRTPARWLRVEG